MNPSGENQNQFVYLVAAVIGRSAIFWISGSACKADAAGWRIVKAAGACPNCGITDASAPS